MSQRPIKFRAWDKEGKVMRPINYLYFATDGSAHTVWTDPETGNRNLKELILMQFTGLYDKDGEEIFEGDVVTFNDYEFGNNFPQEIICITNMISTWGYWNGEARSSIKAKRVIGNIYENPELLEVKS